MFCRQCGKPVDDGVEICEECKGTMGTSNAQANTQQTVNNGQNYNQNQNYNANTNYNNQNPNAKSKLAGGLLGIFLGAFGVHNFYLGYTGKAVAQLLITLLTCGFGAFVSSVWGLIEGILILTGSINTDGQGNPLRD